METSYVIYTYICDGFFNTNLTIPFLCIFDNFIFLKKDAHYTRRTRQSSHETSSLSRHIAFKYLLILIFRHKIFNKNVFSLLWVFYMLGSWVHWTSHTVLKSRKIKGPTMIQLNDFYHACSHHHSADIRLLTLLFSAGILIYQISAVFFCNL